MKRIKILALLAVVALVAAGCFVGARDASENRYPKPPDTTGPAAAPKDDTAKPVSAEVRAAEEQRDRVTPRLLLQASNAEVVGHDPNGAPLKVVLDETEMYKDPQVLYREGRALFQNNCVGCHGHNGCGNVPRSTNFSDPGWQDNNSDGGIYSSIYNGKGVGNGGGAMPAYYNQLSTQQMKYLVAYLRAFKGSSCLGLPTEEDVRRMVAERQAK